MAFHFHFGLNMFPEVPRPFNTQYKCFPVSMLPGTYRQDVERGGKIIMPPSALEQLTRLNINYPMLFKLTNKKTNRITHCGVLEFVADEGKVYLPLWMMHNLLLAEAELINVESVSLPIAKFSRFQPQSEDFLDITNPKAVLENGLRSFACLTTGDVIAIKYNQRIYEMCVLETKPEPAVSIIECDMNVEFAPPVGYVEPEKAIKKDENAVDLADLMPAPAGFVPFKGQGTRLDGKKRKDSVQSEMAANKPTYIRGIPDYDYKIGTLTFLRSIKPVNNKEVKDQDEFKAFTGEGFSLRKSRT
ncbi:ubiquitin recognition factor in ER-associated degradation protein 1 [Hylaeus anthracinus]|uniref:ubiquitin recognition factor in ER-associated degradation protein 1 n=1 Tax=Hylaeus volcanicus TaxID=313075 RepID=UPI0023B7CED9|nr:ubiquitin recognition factor in ER-associated degradation protein 1 [Hylaeus volcanicus]XP_053979657.1 ubiquitin recognition factor in ER-associated degradation protein 1 [Hylaeus volcanicus]XP_054006455.1 ubiquitin recognition factor in ER-associated degradation protein 1 [Hylaeus anthracinus]XP_054006456.1 ubiquitin recognition factor in ER-associated degradation protein 1 [Hylaeus anthracinus]